MKYEIKKWLASAFLLFAFASGGVLAGLPLHSGGMNHSMMDCCKKAKSREQTKEANAARLCCAVYCGVDSSAPNTPADDGSFDFSTRLRFLADSFINQISRLPFAKEKRNAAIAVSSESRTEAAAASRKILPKYLRHHSFLI